MTLTITLILLALGLIAVAIFIGHLTHLAAPWTECPDETCGAHREQERAYRRARADYRKGDEPT